MNDADHASAGSESLREVFLGRQPILDKDQALAGYELLFRTTADGNTAVCDPRAATADVVCKAFAQLGLPNVLGLVRAFINVDASFLSEDVIELLPKDMVVFEVDIACLNDQTTVSRCRELREHGYQFLISGITSVDGLLRPVLELASYLKVDVNALSVDQLQAVTSELKTTRRTLVACRVESQTQMELCALLGYQLFQGYYFAKPDVIEGRTLDASAQGLFRLIQLIAEDAEIDVIETAFRTEPALVVNLLRLTNSVGVGARVRISSVRHAITVIGRRQLQRWLQLLLFSRGDGQSLARNPLMQYAALRGRFMELLAEKLFPTYRDMRDPAFITGLMSVMPAALGMTMENILTQITVDNDVRLALEERSGALGQVLALTERYDDNDVAGVQTLLSQHPGLHIGFLADILAAALQWVQQLDTQSE